MIPVFAFIDIEHSVIAWETYRGVFVSANAEYDPPNCPISMMFAGMLTSQNNVRLQNELLIEKYRQISFPQCISRLYGMYFFEDEHIASSAYKWGGHFHADNLVELELYPKGSVSHYDANWITHAPLDQNGKIISEEWINKYWTGEPYPGKKPMWELIAQGRAVICGTEHRKRAYKKISESYPESVAALEVARIAALVRSDLGHSCAWLIRTNNNDFKLSFYIDFRDANNEEFLEKVRHYEGPCNLEDLSVGGDSFKLPDFREYSREFSVEECISDEFLFSVHRNV